MKVVCVKSINRSSVSFFFSFTYYIHARAPGIHGSWARLVFQLLNFITVYLSLYFFFTKLKYLRNTRVSLIRYIARICMPICCRFTWCVQYKEEKQGACESIFGWLMKIALAAFWWVICYCRWHLGQSLKRKKKKTNVKKLIMFDWFDWLLCKYLVCVYVRNLIISL